MDARCVQVRPSPESDTAIELALFPLASTARTAPAGGVKLAVVTLLAELENTGAGVEVSTAGDDPPAASISYAAQTCLSLPVGVVDPSVTAVPPVTVPVYCPSAKASCCLPLSVVPLNVNELDGSAVYSPDDPPVWS